MNLIVDENIPLAREAFACFGDVQLVHGRKITRETVADADVLIVRSVTVVDEELLDGSRVKFVGTATIGTDHLDLGYLDHAGIGVANAAGSNAQSVVEYVVAAMLEICHRKDLTLRGRTLGIVGHGNIGSRLAKLAPALGLRVLINDPPLQRQKTPGHWVSLQEVLMESNFVSFHVPMIRTGQDRTLHLITHDEYELMRPNAYVINTSRGGVVENGGLFDSIGEMLIAGAVLDVWENEPEIDRGLLNLTTLGTPHIAGYSYDGKINGTRIMHEAVARFLGQEPSWKPSLPLPEDHRIELDLSESATNEDLLRQAVRHAYDIRRDDRRLRDGVEQTHWGGHFDGLRKSYPVRREFTNYTITTPGLAPELQDTLRHLGFHLDETA